MTFCSPQLIEMSFRLPFTDGECGRVELSEGSRGRVDSTGSFAAIVSRTLWWWKRSLKFWRIVSLLRDSIVRSSTLGSVRNFGLSSVPSVLQDNWWSFPRARRPTVKLSHGATSTTDKQYCTCYSLRLRISSSDERCRQVFQPFSLYMANRCHHGWPCVESLTPCSVNRLFRTGLVNYRSSDRINYFFGRYNKSEIIFFNRTGPK